MALRLRDQLVGLLHTAQGLGAGLGRHSARELRAQGLADPGGVSLAPGAHAAAGAVGVQPARGRRPPAAARAQPARGTEPLRAGERSGGAHG